MNHIEKFNETVGILVKAYMNDTLNAVSCPMCAVGNIAAAVNNYTFKKLGWGGDTWLNENGEEVETHWTSVVWNLEEPHYWTGEAEREIQSTGYTAVQLRDIEKAFMGGACLVEPYDNYAGLMAVVDVLADIHGIDLATATASKALFVK